MRHVTLIMMGPDADVTPYRKEHYLMLAGNNPAARWIAAGYDPVAATSYLSALSRAALWSKNVAGPLKFPKRNTLLLSVSPTFADLGPGVFYRPAPIFPWSIPYLTIHPGFIVIRPLAQLPAVYYHGTGRVVIKSVIPRDQFEGALNDRSNRSDLILSEAQYAMDEWMSSVKLYSKAKHHRVGSERCGEARFLQACPLRSILTGSRLS
jgi:hypothetical protein